MLLNRTKNTEMRSTVLFTVERCIATERCDFVFSSEVWVDAEFDTETKLKLGNKH